MYKRGLYDRIGSYKYQLAICRYSYECFQSMKYYVVIRYCDIFENDRLVGYGDGYFIKYENHYDFLSIDEFTQYFTIIPDILHDGYWFSYYFFTTYPFYTKNIEEKGFENFESAAKKAIEMAKKAYFETHGKDGVATFLQNTLKPKR